MPNQPPILNPNLKTFYSSQVEASRTMQPCSSQFVFIDEHAGGKPPTIESIFPPTPGSAASYKHATICIGISDDNAVVLTTTTLGESA